MSKSKKEVSVTAYKALQCKVIELKAENKCLRKESRADRKTIKRIQASRTSWKDKAVERLQTCNSLKKEVLRGSTLRPKGHHYPMWLINLVVIFRIRCNCSYGSIKKILHVLQEDSHYVNSKEEQLPCKETLQNWVSKVGYYYLKKSDNELLTNEVCLIIDESVRVGTERLFLALVCPYEKLKTGSLTYEEVQVIYLAGSPSWTGAKIAEELTKVLQQKGLKVKYVVSDEGTNLKRAAKLMKIPYLADISHLIATCLKKTFKDQVAYKAFAQLVGQCSSKLSMGKYSYLRPYKQRVKSRFMNQSKTIDWASTILDKWESLDEEAQEKLANLETHRPIIEQLKEAINLAGAVAKLLKTSGLNADSIQQAIALVDQELTELTTSEMVKTFASYLKEYLMEYKKFIELEEWKGKTVQVCSDIIERLFGRFKAKVSDNHYVTATTIGLELPLMCLSKKQLTQHTQTALETISMTNLKEWLSSQKSDNQSSRRSEFFEKRA